MTNPGYGKWRQPQRSPVPSRGEHGPNLVPPGGPAAAAAREPAAAGKEGGAPADVRTYTGAFERSIGGSAVESGPCAIRFDNETLTLVPAAGPPRTTDLGDIDACGVADYTIALTVHPGETWRLSKFGKTFEPLAADLVAAWRTRTVACLLLRDLDEVARFDASVRLESGGDSHAGPAELRLYRSNLAVLPSGFAGFQWRLADIDACTFDPADYTTALVNGDARVTVGKLAKRTEEFGQRLRDGMTELAARGAQAVRALFPFLGVDGMRQTCALLKDGRTAPLRELCRVHPGIERALYESVIDASMRPYVEHLSTLSVPAQCGFGFKLMRPEERLLEDGGAEAAGPDAEGEPEAPGKEDLFEWFFFPVATASSRGMPGNLLAWEATSKSGRATYFFRIGDPAPPNRPADPGADERLVRAAIADLDRALGILSFRRSPIYLSDAAIQTQAQYRRYAVACRKIPPLARLRQSFAGRALHTSVDAWKEQVARIVAESARP